MKYLQETCQLTSVSKLFNIRSKFWKIKRHRKSYINGDTNLLNCDRSTSTVYQLFIFATKTKNRTMLCTKHQFPNPIITSKV